MIKINQLDILYKRLKNISINIELIGNYPWIYLDIVNGNKVKDRFKANHGFTIAWYKNTGDIIISDITEVFKVIRKYR